ncbi:MAG: energy transducer TonB [Aliiglaciecola sp.]|uniref:energy transducer TonB n=1 Tax=Aliiglaciecola sp. M165 TaxID=2593649 RepID=UPI00117D9960|nr:energy transducer TonB [Aliiglaciecola sp. M165]TRY33706.1 energy transducer TonB [Aliiglaciecola sp. M165]
MPRILIAIVLAAGVTLGLFYLMQALIKSGDQALSEPSKGSVLDFVRVKKDEVTEQKQRKPRKPPKPEQPPPDMPQPEMDLASSDPLSSGYDFAADVAADVSLEGGLALESGDGEYLPIVKVSPVYPRRALSRGIEGYVIVEFTVTKQGSVSNPTVIEAEPAGIFEQAAVDAALKFKYKPRVINGEAAEVAGVQNRISFQIDG